DPVAAAREGAEVGALVVIDVVAVVAPLARADQVVPADLRRAVELAGALVGVGVTVIAGLARLDLAVAALGIGLGGTQTFAALEAFLALEQRTAVAVERALIAWVTVPISVPISIPV